MIEYKIYQVKSDLTRDYGYMGLLFMKKQNIEVDLDNYILVYQNEIEEDSDVFNTLEKLFRIFNIEHPEDYYGRSMSVSDIIEINNEYYYCDSLGWEKISI